MCIRDRYERFEIFGAIATGTFRLIHQLICIPEETKKTAVNIICGYSKFTTDYQFDHPITLSSTFSTNEIHFDESYYCICHVPTIKIFVILLNIQKVKHRIRIKPR